jgi:leader peptidase (prepilin peptidase)/N-methyltransferase
MIHYLIPEPVIQILIFVVGALMGSFFNVCIHRLPINESIIIPYSHCPNCKAKIKIWENIPIISYIILRGRCRYCSIKISKRYLIVEILTPILFLLLWHTFGFSIDFAIYILFISTLIIITFIDLEHQLILNILTYPMIIIGLLINYFKGVFINALIAGIIGGGIIFLIVIISPLIFKKEGMGAGDFKLAGVIGIFLANWKYTLISLFLASFLGSLVGLGLILLGKKKFGEYIPFGPYLACGAAIVLFWGRDIINWYFKLIS